MPYQHKLLYCRDARIIVELQAALSIKGIFTRSSSYYSLLIDLQV